MYHDFLILGGAGLVGAQIVRQIVQTLHPRRVVIASLLEAEATAACEQHQQELGDAVSFVPAWGNLFFPSSMAQLPWKDAVRTPTARHELLEAVYGDFETALRQNHLVRLIRDHRPEVIVDAVNTATSFSYLDVFDGAAKVRQSLGKDGSGIDAAAGEDVEMFLLCQSVPQLIRHVQFLQRAMTQYETKVYIKVGTTGTGGMGLNIPYTHSEDRPSKKLLAKTEAAFGHTGLLFLLARTPRAPIVKEIKPAAMIGYRAVKVSRVVDKHGSSEVYRPRELRLGDDSMLDLIEEPARYDRLGELRLAVVDTGENGVFTRGEFAAITALGQMEYVTPEEVARTVVQEIRGANTGKDIISALDGSVLGPSYKAGLVRGVALRDLAAAEAEQTKLGGLPSIAIGRLGPPELSKLLFEAALLREVYAGESERVIDRLISDPRSDATIAEALAAALIPSRVGELAPSIGIPILLADGVTVLRGPRINVPEPEGHVKSVPVRSAVDLDGWARRGWVDLRPDNVRRWRERAGRMLQSRSDLRAAGSAAATLQSFMSDRFELGEAVAWIFNNEMGGYRVK